MSQYQPSEAAINEMLNRRRNGFGAPEQFQHAVQVELDSGVLQLAGAIVTLPVNIPDEIRGLNVEDKGVVDESRGKLMQSFFEQPGPTTTIVFKDKPTPLYMIDITVVLEKDKYAVCRDIDMKTQEVIWQVESENGIPTFMTEDEGEAIAVAAALNGYARLKGV